MNKFELASELRGRYDSTDGHSVLLVDDEDCEAMYNKFFG